TRPNAEERPASRNQAGRGAREDPAGARRAGKEDHGSPAKLAAQVPRIAKNASRNPVGRSGHLRTSGTPVAGWVQGAARLVGQGKGRQTYKTPDLAAGKEGNPFPPAKGRQVNESFSPDGARLAIAGFDRKITVYDLASGKATKTIPTDGPVWHFGFSPDGKQIA